MENHVANLSLPTSWGSNGFFPIKVHVQNPSGGFPGKTHPHQLFGHLDLNLPILKPESFNWICIERANFGFLVGPKDKFTAIGIRARRAPQLPANQSIIALL
jgi:hypothetical protein